MATRLIQMSGWRGSTKQWKVEASDGNAALEIAAVKQLGFSSVAEASKHVSLVSGSIGPYHTGLMYWDAFLLAVAENIGPIPRHVIVRNDGNIWTTFRVSLQAKSYNRRGVLHGTSNVTEEWAIGTGFGLDAKGASIYLPVVTLVPFGYVMLSADLQAIDPYRSDLADSKEIRVDTSDF